MRTIGDETPPGGAPDSEPVAWSLEAFAAGHRPQLAAMQDRSQWLHLMCARQSGKTWADDGILFDNALENAESIGVFLGLKGTGVKFSNWTPIWKPLAERHGVTGRAHNETSMLTTFPNDSRVVFAGTDDLTNVRKYLGNRLDRGVFVIDEAQSQSSEVLKYLLTNLLPPMLTPTSRVILSGVLPDVPAGYFYDQAAAEALADAPHLAKSKGWSHHEWGRMANVHTPEARAQLASYMEARGITIDDPQIQRDWFMRRVWDTRATAFRYRTERSSWRHDARPVEIGNAMGTIPGMLLAATPPHGCDLFAVGIDPGTRDRWALVLWGWSSHGGPMYQVAEWVTPRKADALWSQCAHVMEVLDHRYKTIISAFYDAGGSLATLDVFGRHTGFPVLKAAAKADLRGQVDRLADLFATRQAFVMEGSELENDLKLARWDEDARAEGVHKWSSQGVHPDVADAARYGAQAYFNYAEPMKVKLTDAQREDAHWRASLERQPGVMESHVNEDDQAPGTPYGGPVDY